MPKTKLISDALNNLIATEPNPQPLLDELAQLEKAAVVLKSLREDDCDDDLIRIAEDGSAYMVKGREFDEAIEKIFRKKTGD